jgi:hypothetical protein
MTTTYPAASTARFRVQRLPPDAGDLSHVIITDLETGESEEFASIDTDDQRRWMARQEFNSRVAVSLSEVVFDLLIQAEWDRQRFAEKVREHVANFRMGAAA